MAKNSLSQQVVAWVLLLTTSGNIIFMGSRKAQQLTPPDWLIYLTVQTVVVGLTTYLLMILFAELEKQRKPSKRSASRRRSKQKQVPKDLENRLLCMVGGERDVAERLVAYSRAGNEHRGEEWAYQDAIDRLIADRR